MLKFWGEKCIFRNPVLVHQVLFSVDGLPCTMSLKLSSTNKFPVTGLILGFDLDLWPQGHQGQLILKHWVSVAFLTKMDHASPFKKVINKGAIWQIWDDLWPWPLTQGQQYPYTIYLLILTLHQWKNFYSISLQSKVIKC